MDCAEHSETCEKCRSKFCGSIGSFVSQVTHGCELLVNGVGRQMPRFQIHAIAHDDDAVEGEPRLGAIPSDELVDGIPADTARGR